jgi:A/G-specific adenine glycosylase
VDSDPYPVLVSEVMLQQTQVSRVIPKFCEFMVNWPKVTKLAEAPTDELLRTWSGLGYNSRALRLREASRLVAANGWPDSIKGLMGLPGIGPYTAAAIASISFGENVPAVDTNLRRVLSRWAGEPLEGSALDEYAHDVIGSPAGDWNQALMDLGSTLCTPKEPMCTSCPVSEWCADPAVYEPPTRQSMFEGSHRQLRGALLRAHLAGRDLLEAGHDLHRSDMEIRQAVTALELEGLIGPDV